MLVQRREEDANTFIAPLLGLPELPFIPWLAPQPATPHVSPDGVFWKTPHIVTWARGRAFAWIDDEITDADRTWVQAHHNGPALLHRVDPRHGLTDIDFTALAVWASALSGTGR